MSNHTYINNTETHWTNFTNLGSKKRSEGIKQPKRMNIIMLSLPRSGSSFLGNVFNHHPQVLYLFEPLHSLQRHFNEHSLFEFDFSLASYRALASKFLEDVMFCDFSDGEFASKMLADDRIRSLALNSPPFCVKSGTSSVCQSVNSHELETVCNNNYSVTAMKILTPRIPGQLGNKQFLSSCFSNRASECRIIHLVRDPRAVIHSLMALKFFSRQWEPRRELRWFVEKVCRQLEFDVRVGKLTKNSLSARYKLIRFEDLARHPLSTVDELYKFAGLEMLDSIKTWLYKATHLKDTSQGDISKAYRTSRNSEQTVSNWRKQMSSSTVQMIEKYCGRVMSQLGYKFTGMSLKDQLNLNISLID